MKRRNLLDEAANLVDGDRNAQYGDPNDDFLRTSKYWSTHAGGVFRRKLNERNISVTKEVMDVIDGLFDTHDVAIMMVQLKNSRLAWSPDKRDHWVDGAGYMACGWDCVSSREK